LSNRAKGCPIRRRKRKQKELSGNKKGVGRGRLRGVSVSERNVRKKQIGGKKEGRI